MQLAYLFHQRAKSLLSRDSRMADCTVRYPGVERSFSSLKSVLNIISNSYRGIRELVYLFFTFSLFLSGKAYGNDNPNLL